MSGNLWRHLDIDVREGIALGLTEMYGSSPNAEIEHVARMSWSIPRCMVYRGEESRRHDGRSLLKFQEFMSREAILYLTPR